MTVRPAGSQRYYQANPDSPLYAELCGIVQKTVWLADPLREDLQPLAASIEAAFVYGSVAKGRDSAASDIDLMLISDTLSYADTFTALEAARARLGRTVNPTILSKGDLARRLKDDSALAQRLMSQSKIWLIGSDDDLRV